MREQREQEWKKVNDILEKTDDMCRRRHQEILRKLDRCREEAERNRTMAGAVLLEVSA